jgi:hypothetical protein
MISIFFLECLNQIYFKDPKDFENLRDLDSGNKARMLIYSKSMFFLQKVSDKPISISPV